MTKTSFVPAVILLAAVSVANAETAPATTDAPAVEKKAANAEKREERKEERHEKHAKHEKHEKHEKREKPGK